MPEQQQEKIGTLIGWNAGRGFGFLKSGDGDTFVHASQLAGISPRVGSRFAFETIPDRRGRRQAVNVRLI